MEKETGKGKKPTSKKKLTVKAWAKIESRYLMGDPVSAIAYDHKISKRTIESRARRGSWKHGSRMEAVAKKIKEEVEDEIIDTFKIAVTESNEEHIKLLKNGVIVANKILRGTNRIVDGKMALLKEYEDAKLHVPLDSKIDFIDETRVVVAINRSIQSSVGGTQRSILGIEDLPLLSENKEEKGMSEMAQVLQRGIERRAISRRVEEKEKMRAEIIAELSKEKESSDVRPATSPI